MFQNMQQREKVLLFAFLGVAIVWFAWPSVKAIFITPVTRKQSELANVEGKLEKLKDEHFQFQLAESRLKDWKNKSLPPESLDAQRLYKDWLEDLAKLSELKLTSVVPALRPSRGKIYSAVQVTLDGEATFSKLCTFLYHFYRADLMHRVFSLDIDSTGNEGNPLMKFSLTAEGLSIQGIPDRRRIFSETFLASDLASDQTEMEVASTRGFPSQLPKGKKGFRIRIGQEYLLVTAMKGTKWTVERAFDSTRQSTHKADEVVELARISRKMKDRTLKEYRETLMVQSPFVLPVEYDPKILPLGEIVVIRGEPLRRKVQTSGFDPVKGEPVFELTDTDKIGLEIDPVTGEMVWEPSKDQKIGKFPAKVVVNQTEDAENILSQPFVVSLIEPNTPPVLESVGKKTVFAGESLKFTAKATDADEPKNTLSFKLGAGAPAGATINPQSGEFQWAPSTDTEARDHVVEVIVSDNGTPAKSSSEKVTIVVIDDTARFTRLVGSIVRGGEPEAWLYDRSSNKKMILKEGAPFKMANIEAFVLTIGHNFVLMQIDGKTWRLELGEDLRSMKELQEEQTSDLPVPTAATANSGQ